MAQKQTHRSKEQNRELSYKPTHLLSVFNKGGNNTQLRKHSLFSKWCWESWISSVQSLSHVRFFAIPWTAAYQASLSITNSQSLPKPMSIESVMPSNHLILCHPLLLLLSIFPSIRVFSKVSVLHMRWPKYWCFSFNISPSSEHPGLISIRMDWLNLFAVQGTPKSLLQHHSSKASILWCWVFFIVQLTSIHYHWKNHSLDCCCYC